MSYFLVVACILIYTLYQDQRKRMHSSYNYCILLIYCDISLY